MPPVQAFPKLGDLIEIQRFGYQHWVIYVGDGYVVHLAPPSEYAAAGSSSIMSVLSSRAYVKMELLEDVAGDHSYKVNNKFDADYTPLPPGKIVKRAVERVGQELPYAIASDNCEHFVTEIRYGIKLSTQVETAATYATWGAIGFAVLSAVGFMANRNRRQNQ